MPIRLFKERVTCNWRKFIRMSIRRSRYPAKLTKSRQAMRSGSSLNWITSAANVSRRILLSGVFGGSQVRPALPPSAARVLLAPFWSGPAHVV